MKKVLIVICFLLGISSKAQGDLQKKYQERLLNSTDFSFIKQQGYAKSNNAYQFMTLGYFLNANDIMYAKTRDIKYLDLNIEILKIIVIEKSKYNYNDNAWLMKVGAGNQNESVNGQESLIYEGYFFRYVAEFLDIIKTNNLYKDLQDSILVSLKKSFNKWYTKSESKYKDASNLYHQRVHIAANWATTALYLYKYTNEQKFKNFYTTFDKQLKSNLKEKRVNSLSCYVWNSTYSSLFTNSLKGLKNYRQEIQDVSHANHVINYVITANKIEPAVWTRNDLEKFSNTLAEIICKDNKFSDDVDGSISTTKGLINTGWKQSDGWMKLIPYNSKLTSIYTNYYKVNTDKVDKSTYALQFIANLYKN